MAAQKVVLIAGISSEIGQATAELLVEKGYRVFGASRTAPAPAPQGVEIVTLDATSDTSVNACMDAVAGQAGRIDVLINLISYVLEGAIEESSVDEAKANFETNFFATLRLIQAVLPIMRRQGSARIINVSALSGVIAVPFMGIFTATRFAIEGLSEALWHEVKPFGIHVSLLQIMSPIRTRVFERSFRSAEQSLDEYKAARTGLVNFIRTSTEQGPGPEIVAEAFLRIIEKDKPKIRYQVGPMSRMITMMRRMMPDTTLQSMMGKRMLGN